MRTAIHAVRHEFDEAELLAVWNEAVDTPTWDQGWLPVHGDLTDGNLLVGEDGRLRAVIDWSLLGTAEPANDLDIAWDLFEGASRSRFRAVAGIDDATWARGRGWAIRAVIGIPYYERTNPGIVLRARRRVRRVLLEVSGS